MLLATTVVVTAAALPASLPQAAEASVSGPWPSFQHDALHTGVSPDASVGASNAPGLTRKWRTPVGSAGHAPATIGASPAVVPNRTLGKTLAYIANAGKPSNLDAIDVATGAVVWRYAVSQPVWTSPAVNGNTVYIGAASTLYAVNATTGKLQCSIATTGQIYSSPVVAKIDASGPVVFFGDTGASETSNAGHEWAVNGVGNAAGQCTTKWTFNSFINKGPTGTNTGVWSPSAIGTNSSGRKLVVFGSSQPDDAVYALDATTGGLAWHFQTKALTADDDVGAGPTIGAPGVNGFTDGVVYIDGKDMIEYAINLRTGAKIWEFNLGADSGVVANCQSTAALVGRLVIVPEGPYMYALNAVTGAKLWRSVPASGQYVSSPGVSGAPGNQVAFAGDLSGVERAYRLTDGAAVFSYATGASRINSSAAISSGRVLFAAKDGNLYALG